jgi:hypothetical protein
MRTIVGRMGRRQQLCDICSVDIVKASGCWKILHVIGLLYKDKLIPGFRSDEHVRSKNEVENMLEVLFQLDNRFYEYYITHSCTPI